MPGAGIIFAEPTAMISMFARLKLEITAISTEVRRLLVSSILGLLSGLGCFAFLSHMGTRAGDFTWAYDAALDLLHGRDPYRLAVGPEWIPYPLPAALVALPLVVFSASVAAGIFIGISSSLMAYGLSKDGFVRLMVFLSCPFWVSVQWAQWSPLIVASAFFPVVMFTLVVKPHIAGPIAITHLSKIGVIAAFVLLVASLLIYPSWPFRWLGQIGQYQRFIPLFTIPGPLLLLALRRWRERDAVLFLIASILPQRWFYDALILWLIPKTRKELLYTATISWLAYFWRIYHWPTSSQEVGVVCVLFFYLPMLFVVLRRAPLQSSTPQS